MIYFCTEFKALRHVNRSYKHFNCELFPSDLASMPFQAAQSFVTVDDAYIFSKALLFKLLINTLHSKTSEKQIPYINNVIHKQNNDNEISIFRPLLTPLLVFYNHFY